MSSPDRKKRSLRPILSVLALAAGLAAVSACTVRPLYSNSTTPASGTVTGSVASELSAVSVKPVITRVGQEVRNHLIFLLGGGRGEPAEPRYSLQLSVSSGIEATANIQVNKENEPTAAILTAFATYTLTASDGTVVGKGRRQFAASYDVPRQEFAAVRAQRDAENRAARELAELVRLSIAQDLANPAIAKIK